MLTGSEMSANWEERKRTVRGQSEAIDPNRTSQVLDGLYLPKFNPLQ